MSCETAEIKPFYHKIYRKGRDIILAVCDADIIGKKFEEGERVLEARPEFYEGERIGEEVLVLFEEATIINLLGRKIVTLAVERGWVEKNGILEVKGVLHAQIVKMLL